MSNVVKQSRPRIKQASKKDCILLAKHLREADLQEINHGTGLDPEVSLLYAFALSDSCYSAWINNQIILMYGCGGHRGVFGSPWMLASDLLTNFKREFVVQCRGITEKMLDNYGYLENYVWAGNTKHIHWLKWLGFTICEPTPHGIDGEPFHKFYMKR